MDLAAHEQAYASIRAAFDADRWEDAAAELGRLDAWLRSAPAMTQDEAARLLQLHVQCAELLERARMRLLGKTADLTRGQRAVAAYGKGAPQFPDEDDEI